MKSKGLRTLIAGLLSMVLVCSIGACQPKQSDETNNTVEQVSGTEQGTPTEIPATPTATPVPEITYAPDEDIKPTGASIGIHDPSIFFDPVSGKYYSYGSHMVCGTSDNMVSWKYICNSSVGTAATNQIFDKDFRQEFAEVFSWLDIAKDSADFGIWALDVTYSKAAADAGKDPYFMYVSLVNNTTQSAIALATANNPEGPFHYAGTIVCADFRQNDIEAGHTNLLEVLGKNSVSDMTAEEKSFYFTKDTADYKSKFVDCIDAAPFYDADGNFYIVYGSFSSMGGLRILKMDPLTGLRSSDNYDYTDDGRQDPYYGKQIAQKRGEGPYIIWVESDLSSTGYYYFLFWSQGVLRSTGGYNMRMLRSEYPDHGYMDYMGNDAFSNTNATTLGVRIMDNFQFAGMNFSSTANGGNSAIVRQDGKIFLHYHSKSAHNEAYGENGFVIKSNQMFLNEEGWLVTAPFKFGGESIRPVAIEDVVGDYEFVYHRLQYYSDPVNFNDNFVSSEMITLNADGTVTGDYEGTWTLKDTYFTITIDGKEYKGVTLQQYDENKNGRTYTTVFTASGTDNRTVWGSKIYYTDEERVDIDFEVLSVAEYADADFEIPTLGRLHSDITWISDNPAVVIDGNTAKVICQDSPQFVNLTATVKFGSVEKTADYSLLVPMEDFNIPETISSDSIDLPRTTATGNKITWTSSDESIINPETGAVNIPDAATDVKLTGTIENSTRVIRVTVTVMQMPDTVVYEENFDTIASIDTASENSLWYSKNAAPNLTLKADPQGGKYIEFAPGSANSRGAQSKFAADLQLPDTYLLEFDLALTAGNNQTTEFAVVNKNMAYNGVINDGIASGYLFKLAATNSTTWTINDQESFDIPAGAWVHVSVLAQTSSGKCVVTVTDANGNELYSGSVFMNGAGALWGFYVRGGRYNSVTCVDNVVVKVQ